MKKYLLNLLVLFMSFSIFSDAPQMPQMDPFDILNSMDPKEFEKIMDELSKMSPEELQKYAQIGEEMFKNSGYDLDEVEKAFQNPNAPRPVPQPMPAQKPLEEKPKKDFTPQNMQEKAKVLYMINTLSSSLASIRQKASADDTLLGLIAPLEHQLNLLTAYLNKMSYEKHLKFLEEKDFAELKTKLSGLAATLEELDYHLVVPEFVFGKNIITREYKQKIEKAKVVLEKVKTTLTESFTTHKILTDIESLFKKYDQEALTIKKDIEAKEKKASEQKGKLPTTNTGNFPAIPKYMQPNISHHAPSGGSRSSSGGSSYSSGGSSHSGYKPSSGFPQPPTPTSSSSGRSQPEASASGAKKGTTASKDKGSTSSGSSDKDDAKKDKDEPTEIPLTLEQRVEKVQKELRAVNTQVGFHKAQFLQIARDLAPAAAPADADGAAPAAAVPGVNPNPEVIDLLEENMRPLKKILGELKKIFEDYDKKDIKVARHNKNVIRDFITKQLPDIIEIITAFETVRPIPAADSQERKDAGALLKSCVDTWKKISNLSASRSLN